MSADTIKSRPWGLADRLPRPYCCIVVTLAYVLGASPASGQANVGSQRPPAANAPTTDIIQGPDTPTPLLDVRELREAAAAAQELFDAILAIDGSEDGSLRYEKSIIDRMGNFYRSGSMDPDVTREVCRETVVAIIWDLFLMRVHDPSADDVTEVSPGDTEIQNALDEPSKRLFRRFLMNELLPTAPRDLSTLQQARLYRLAGLVLRPEGDRAIEVLNDVADQFDPTDKKRALVELAIDDLSRGLD